MLQMYVWLETKTAGELAEMPPVTGQGEQRNRHEDDDKDGPKQSRPEPDSNKHGTYLWHWTQRQ